MPKAIWNGTTIAESDETIVVEGNHYFPRDSVDSSVLRNSALHTWCGWKGEASYFSLAAEGEEAKDAAWCYSDAKDAAKEIEGYVAFGTPVQVA